MKMEHSPGGLRIPWTRAVMLAGGMFLLLAGMVAGLQRLGWRVPSPAQLAAIHGPLMVCGFLGSLLSLERAVAVGRGWTFLGPALAIGGSVLLVAGAPRAGIALISVSSFVLIVLFGLLLARHGTFYLTVMAAGASCWSIGNVLWMLGWPIFLVVWWWAGFLMLTIIGERLEMGRMTGVSVVRQWLCGIFLYLFLAGLLIQLIFPGAAAALIGGSLLLLAGWLACFDIARRTVKIPGLPRFVAVCLLSGYGWLAIAGVLMVVWGVVTPFARLDFADALGYSLAGGLQYDAVLHALFLGFVFGMIFGHAPIIFPAVLRLPMKYGARLYVHWGLLQATLAARIVGDVAGSDQLRRWAGLLNVLTILVFLVNTGMSAKKGGSGVREGKGVAGDGGRLERRPSGSGRVVGDRATAAS